MALLRAEPGGDYTTNLTLVADATQGFVVGNVFYGGTALGIRTQAGQALSFNIPATDTVIYQDLVQIDSGQSGSFLRFMEGATIHVDLRMTVGGNIQITRNGTVLGTSVDAIPGGSQNYLGFKAKIADVGGWAVLTINGVEWLNLTNVDTRNGLTGLCNIVQYNSNPNATRRDIIIMDGIDGTTLIPPQNAAFNDLLGPVRLSCKFPNAAGTYSQGTITGASTIQEALDETNIDSDTSFVALATGEKFTNNLQDMTQTGATVHGVVLFDASRVDDASTVTQRQIAKLEANESQLTARNLGASYTFDRQVLAKPGGGAWTVADVNALEIGVERTV
jgi:hypothetical protein